MSTKLYWTMERCIDEASKYATRTEWKKSSRGSYDAAYRKGWMDECFPKRGVKLIGRELYWTRERCIESARGYSKKSEWKKSCGGAWDAAHRSGWLEDCYRVLGD